MIRPVGLRGCALLIAAAVLTASDGSFLMNDLFATGAPLPSSIDKADVIFAVDTTGSMGGEITNLRDALTATIIPQIRALLPDVAFGVTDFRDFGEPTLWVVKLRQRIQTVFTPGGVATIQAGVNVLSAGGGGDIPEAGWEAMYSIAGGPPITVMEYTSTFDLGTTPPPAGETHGTVGGAGFRAGALPIVIAITDAEWHDAPGSGGLNPYGPGLAGVPSRAQAIARLNAINARVISIVSPSPTDPSDPRTQGRLLAEATGATVLPAAWGATGRPPGCSVTQCCTAQGGAGEAPSSPGGMCPLVYRLSGAGTGLGTSLVNGVQMLLLAATPASTSTVLNSSPNPAVSGQMVTFTATVSVESPGSGTPTGTVTFLDGATTLGIGSLSSGQATLGTSALAAGSHSITAMYGGDSNFSGSTSSALIQTVQPIAPPPIVTATATSPTAVMVSWLASSGAASYEVARSSSGSMFGVIGSSVTTSFIDSTASSNTAYLYAVRAVDGAGGRSIYSNADLATTVMFSNDPLVAQTTVIKAVHVSELRTAVQAVRGLAGLKPASFTDATIDTTVMIQAAHISELRSALDAARAALELPALRYTDPTLAAGATIIKAAHFQELRLGVQ